MEEWMEVYRVKPINFVMTSGGYDPLHPGHVSYLLDAVGVNPGIMMIHIAVVNGDAFLREKKGKPFMPLMDRCKVVSGVKGVKAVLAYEAENEMTVSPVIEALKPGWFAKGGDRTSKRNIPEWQACENAGTKLVTGVGHKKEWASSNYLKKWKEK
jgi:bifunctional ADP-heptose synthase (sugar kinase/adenylyltransferase)